LSLLNEAVRLDPASENGWLSLGNIYYNLSKTNPDKPETREADKKITKSIESFTACLIVNSRNFECRYGLAAALIDAGKCGSAVEQLLICKDMKPNIKKIYLSLGQAYDCMASGNMKTADEYRNEAVTKTE
jgi:predicted Zn-dependent protease